MEFKAYLNQKYQGYDSFIENIIYPIFGEDRYSTAYNGEILNQIPELRPLAERSGISSVIYCGDIDLEDNPVRLFDTSSIYRNLAPTHFPVPPDGQNIWTLSLELQNSFGKRPNIRIRKRFGTDRHQTLFRTRSCLVPQVGSYQSLYS